MEDRLLGPSFNLSPALDCFPLLFLAYSNLLCFFANWLSCQLINTKIVRMTKKGKEAERYDVIVIGDMFYDHFRKLKDRTKPKLAVLIRESI